MFTDDQKAALAAPLSRAHVKERKQAGRKLSYLEGHWVIQEANRIFGFDGWTRQTVSLEETNRDLVTLQGDDGPYQQWRIGYLAKVRITVHASIEFMNGEKVAEEVIIREGTGFGSGMARPELLGDAVESAAKEAETDAMKRALMTFGNPFGLALYDKTQENVQDAPPSPVNGSPAPVSDFPGDRPPRSVEGIRRLTSARAKELGKDKDFRKLVEACESEVAVDALERNFDKLTAEHPLSWLESMQNELILRREAIIAQQNHAAMDREFSDIVS